MEATLEHKRLQCKELVATDRLSCVKTLTRLFDALATPENGVLPDDAEHYPAMIELWFQFALIWGSEALLLRMAAKSRSCCLC